MRSIQIQLVFVLLTAPFIRLNAQTIERQVFAAGGGTALAGGGIQIDYTIGEAVVAPLSSSGLLLTQGFQQPFTYVLGSNSIFPFLALYPNPTQGNTILHFALPSEGTLEVQVFNAIGQPVLRAMMHYASGESQYLLKTERLLPGTYFVMVSLQGYGTVSKQLLKLDK
ncbi:MAG: T9SS type A sorting domain-containing protein [Bacteroidetes bacterium]|nr:T9SS type A sorting domain-containing protein [Bacteroidota bacterium]